MDIKFIMFDNSEKVDNSESTHDRQPLFDGHIQNVHGS